MRIRMIGRALVGAAVLVIAFAPPARAQVAEVEVGASLLNFSINWGGNSTSKTTTLGIPGGTGFNIGNPGLYGSVFFGSKVAVEPQLGLIVISSGGTTQHFLSVAGQVDYFLNGSRDNSPFVFGSVGVINTSGNGPSPKSFSGGAGYRMLFGDRLAVRVDGRIMHLTDEFGNAVVFAVSFGGLFGQR